MTYSIAEKLEKAANQKPIVGYFGYGSLVNKHTLRTKYIALTPAIITGWRRTWDAPAGNDFNDNAVSLLTARPDTGASIKGAVVFDYLENLAQVDKREHNYKRHEIDPNSLDLGPDPSDLLSSISCPFYTYEAIESPNSHSQTPPILQSYLDAVLQGFLHMHGKAGIEQFVAQTGKFDTPILKDRNAPIYPRSVELSADERDLIDYILQNRKDISFI